jgi:hypothetical protein
VNGSLQSAEFRQSLKQKCIHNPADLFNYSKNGSSTSITAVLSIPENKNDLKISANSENTIRP